MNNSRCHACNNIIDDPTLDGTDLAHPAWFRGSDMTIKILCTMITKWISNPLDRNAYGVFGSSDLNNLRRLILTKKKELRYADRFFYVTFLYALIVTVILAYKW